MLSVILPAYNEEKMIARVTDTISEILNAEKIPYQLLFVDDGSKDNTWKNICLAADSNPNVVGIHFSRNFGKEAAMFAGLEKAEGNCAVILDCDLQHPPAAIVEMYRLWQQGYEVVEGIKEDRGKENTSHRLAAGIFYKIISCATKFDMSDASDFKLLDRKVIDTLNSLPERHAFFRALSFWVGFKKATVTYRVQERAEGVSKWSKWALVKYAFNNITSFSSTPMQIVTIFGLLNILGGIGFGIAAVCRAIMGIHLTIMWGILLILLFSTGMIMLALGIIGSYISKIYDETRGRPRFIISEIKKNPRRGNNTKKPVSRLAETEVARSQ